LLFSPLQIIVKGAIYFKDLELISAISPFAILNAFIINTINCIWLPFRTVAQNRDLFFALLKRDFTNRTSGTGLGAFWLLAQPALQVVAFWFLLDVILRVRFPGNVSFLDYFLIGMIPWVCLSEVMQRSVRLYGEFASIFKKTPFPLELLPLLSITIAVTIYTPIYLIVAFILYDFSVIFPALIVMIIIFLWLIPIVYLFSILGLFIRDFAQVVPFILTMSMYVTPILYMPQMIPEEYQFYLAFNPFADLIALFHSLVENKQLPETGITLRILLEWLLLLAPAWWMFNRAKKHIREAV